jgi:hypothetical protein
MLRIFPGLYGITSSKTISPGFAYINFCVDKVAAILSLHPFQQILPDGNAVMVENV